MQTTKRVRKSRGYAEPKKPKPGKLKFKIEILGTASDRQNHFLSYNEDEDDYDDEDDDDEEDIGQEARLSDRHNISLKEVNDLVSKQGLKEKDIYFTAVFDEDYLVLEVIYVQKMNYEQQLKEFEMAHAEWEKQQKLIEKQHLEEIDRQVKSLQRQAEILKNKKT